MPGLRFFTQYDILLNEVRKIATDKNRNFIDEMDSFLWVYGMMNGTAGTGFISRDWGNMAPAADWYYKARQWLND